MKLGAGGVTMLIFGQKFVDAHAGSANGTYTDQVHRFRIVAMTASNLNVVPPGGAAGVRNTIDSGAFTRYAGGIGTACRRTWEP